MPFKQVPVRPIQVLYICDSCDTGQYLPTGSMLLSDPPQFPHECSVCGDKRTFMEKYPTLRYVREGELLNLGEEDG